MPKPRVLLIGWDAADWKVIRPLLQAGEMPNLARLISAGVHGNIATVNPVLSPMLWTSIATGKRAFKHGIHGFAEPLPDGSDVRPITLLSRKTKAVWNILNQTGHRSIVVGWWPSHPAEPINGAMVSNFFQHPSWPAGTPSRLPAGTVHPPELEKCLGDLRVNPMELAGEFIRPFIPEYQKVDQAADKRLHTLGKIIAETMSIHGAATELLENQSWDFAAIYYSGIDHFCHGFMRYHPPRLPWVSEKDFALYKDVVANAYRYHDAMLGTLLRLADENTTVILMSDHGFHPDHLRTAYIPAEPAGPAVEHRAFGILCLKGPGVQSGREIYGAGILDICPTVLALFGLSPGKDMDGKVLLNAFKDPAPVEPIETWDAVPGDAGVHPPEARLDSAASAEAYKQLVELGYVAPPGADAQEAVDETLRELKYNLARSYRDGQCCGEAITLAEELWTRWPKEHRFGLFLIDCLAPIGQLARRRAAIEELERRIDRYQAEAQAEFARREREQKPDKSPGEGPASPEQRRRLFEDHQLSELAHGRPLVLEWLKASQAMMEDKPAEARKHLQKLSNENGSIRHMNQRVAAALMDLGDREAAEQLIHEALELEPENSLAKAQLAAIHLEAGRCDEAVEAAAESLSLEYFQPGVHALLGHALMKQGQHAAAEKELLVAVAQNPRNLTAHELLGRLFRDHLNRPAEAYAHEGRAMSLRHELAAQKRDGNAANNAPARDRKIQPPVPEPLPEETSIPEPFESNVDRRDVVTVVSGLPRSGTSMTMQLLQGAGREILSDGKRSADEDNPLGYFEFAKAMELARDKSWLPQARGKVVKIVAQLLPLLPRGEHYQVVFMQRNLPEVIASQKTMLARQHRRGADLEDPELVKTYEAHIARVRHQLANRPEIRVLHVDYERLLSDPEKGIERLAAFLGQPFDKEAAAQKIRPELRHQASTR